MRIIFLGTAASISTASNRLPAIAFHLDNGEIILFDTGEDVQRAFEQAGLKMNKPLTIFITHMHGDHVIGLPGLLFRLNLLSRTEPVEVLGPRGLFFYLLAHRVTVGLNPRFPIRVQEISLEENKIYQYPALDPALSLDGIESKITIKALENGIVKRARRYTVQVFGADHTAKQNFGFIFQEEPHPGKFLPEQALALKVPRGHLWGKLQQGKTVRLKDGREIDPVKDGITGPRRPGKCIVVSGDTRPSPWLANFVAGTAVDLLIHEATFLDELQDMAVQKKHATIGEACMLASNGKVKQLALTHFSSRHIDDLERIETLAKERFQNVIIARDQTVINLNKSE